MRTLKKKEELFWNKVNKTNKCWLWTACINNKGYGVFNNGAKNIYAHRYSYELKYKNFDKNKNILHKCDNPLCVNPDHLFIGDQNDNMKDKVSKGRNKRKNTISSYHGVSYRTICKKWRAYHFINYKFISLGNYNTEKEAAEARDKYIIKMKINVPLNFKE